MYAHFADVVVTRSHAISANSIQSEVKTRAAGVRVATASLEYGSYQRIGSPQLP